jgi:hypothetical protein
MFVLQKHMLTADSNNNNCGFSPWANYTDWATTWQYENKCCDL